MKILGFANTSVFDVMDAASMCESRDQSLGPVLFSNKPKTWGRKPPGLFLTARLATLKAISKLGNLPGIAVLFDGWMVIQGAGIPVLDAEPSPSDPNG